MRLPLEIRRAAAALTGEVPVRISMQSSNEELCTGCQALFGPQDESLEIRSDRQSYVQGESARITLVNRSQDGIEAYICLSDVEHLVGTGWQRVGRLMECELVIVPGHFLAPGDSVQKDVQLRQTLFSTPGDYRLKNEALSRRTGRFSPLSPVGICQNRHFPQCNGRRGRHWWQADH
jgi:hypothetical protein